MTKSLEFFNRCFPELASRRVPNRSFTFDRGFILWRSTACPGRKRYQRHGHGCQRGSDCWRAYNCNKYCNRRCIPDHDLLRGHLYRVGLSPGTIPWSWKRPGSKP